MAERTVAASAVAVVRQQAVDGLAFAYRCRRGQVAYPAGLGVATGAAIVTVAARLVAIDNKAFGGEVPLNLGPAAATAPHSTLFRLGRVPPARVRGSSARATVR